VDVRTARATGGFVADSRQAQINASALTLMITAHNANRAQRLHEMMIEVRVETSLMVASSSYPRPRGSLPRLASQVGTDDTGSDADP
jgi:hypothetical protein